MVLTAETTKSLQWSTTANDHNAVTDGLLPLEDGIELKKGLKAWGFFWFCRENVFIIQNQHS